MSELHSVLDFPLSVDRKLLTSAPGAPSPTGHEQTRPSSSYGQASLDYNLTILAALVCFLIFMIALNKLLRCLFSCRRRMVLHLSDGVADTGLKKAAMKALPVVAYTATSKPPGVATDCPICLGEFVEGEKVRVLPECNHGFHLECIDEWLVSHSSCPMCRHSLNLHNKNPGGAGIAEATASNNGVQIVISL